MGLLKNSENLSLGGYRVSFLRAPLLKVSFTGKRENRQIHLDAAFQKNPTARITRPPGAAARHDPLHLGSLVRSVSESAWRGMLSSDCFGVVQEKVLFWWSRRGFSFLLPTRFRGSTPQTTNHKHQRRATLSKQWYGSKNHMFLTRKNI